MKARRKVGATHSFRLSIEASEIVENITHPVKLGGKSRRVSDAIEWYFSERGLMPSYDELLKNIEALQAQIIDLGSKNLENRRLPPTSWFRKLVHHLTR